MQQPIALPARTAGLSCIVSLVAAVLLSGGCVSQRLYDKARGQSEELARALEAERVEVRDLDQRVTGLQTSNRQLDAATTETLAAIQRELEQEALWRRHADERLAVLQTQAASLLNQNRLLAHEMAEAKQERTTLQAMVAQYKEELTAALPPLAPTPALPPLSPPPTAPMSVPAPASVSAPPAQAAPPAAVAPVKPTVPTSAPKHEPAQADESWIGRIKQWVSSLWEWIFG